MSSKFSIVSHSHSNVPFNYLDDYFVVVAIDSRDVVVKISPGKFLNINSDLQATQQHLLMSLLQNNSSTFS
jgi:hypothetical protein